MPAVHSPMWWSAGPQGDGLLPLHPQAAAGHGRGGVAGRVPLVAEVERQPLGVVQRILARVLPPIAP